jgi:predicted nucleic acid-binding protein
VLTAIADVDVLASLEYLGQLIEPIDCELHGEFETEARERMRGRDENDWPVLATALGLGCDIWTEDRDFFGTGIAVWTTNRIEILLKSQKNKMEGERG